MVLPPSSIVAPPSSNTTDVVLQQPQQPQQQLGFVGPRRDGRARLAELFKEIEREFDALYEENQICTRLHFSINKPLFIVRHKLGLPDGGYFAPKTGKLLLVLFSNSNSSRWWKLQ